MAQMPLRSALPTQTSRSSSSTAASSLDLPRTFHTEPPDPLLPCWHSVYSHPEPATQNPQIFLFYLGIQFIPIQTHRSNCSMLAFSLQPPRTFHPEPPDPPVLSWHSVYTHPEPIGPTVPCWHSVYSHPEPSTQNPQILDFHLGIQFTDRKSTRLNSSH